MATVLVDTNVISDVLFSDPVWDPWSSAQLITHAGELAVNPIIYSELCTKFNSTIEVDTVLHRFGLDYLELPREALFLAAHAFKKYRQQGGTRTAPLPDFFVGAHAEASGLSILTRDTRRYATYFPAVALISP